MAGFDESRKLFDPHTWLFGKYQLIQHLSGGSFGSIFLARNAQGAHFAVKREEIGGHHPQLRHEYKVYRELRGCHGFPRAHYYGTEGDYNYLVLDLMGNSLEELFRRRGNHFSLKTVIQIAIQLIDRLEEFHSKHVIHRDIKPDNMMLGGGSDSSTIYLIDFGLSKRYFDPKTGKHHIYEMGKSFRGTRRYSSINSMLGIEQSRRDDLESVAYVLIYLMRGGQLPWQGLKGAARDKKSKMIRDVKVSTPVETLCEGMPSVFKEFLMFARGLEFSHRPDYDFAKDMFMRLYIEMGYTLETIDEFDWNESIVAEAEAKDPTVEMNEGEAPPPDR